MIGMGYYSGMNRTGTNRTCQSCNCTFYVPAWRESNGKVAKFCSISCKAKFGSPLKGSGVNAKAKCEHCNKEYPIKSYRSNTTKYCSTQCHGAARSSIYIAEKAKPAKFASKRCSKCCTEKSLSEFPNRKSSVDGFRADCKSCFSVQQRDWRIRNAEKKKETDRRLYQENKESRQQWSVNYYVENKATIAVRTKRYYAETKPDFIARARTRKISKRCATPVWADLDAIREIYRQCEAISVATGIRHHVDHEIPLQGKLVCGLHVHNNLRIIPAADNLKKRNKFEVE